MRSPVVRSDVQIIVERRGYGTLVWWWRLVHETSSSKMTPLGKASHGYRSAQCALEAASVAFSNIQRTAH